MELLQPLALLIMIGLAATIMLRPVFRSLSRSRSNGDLLVSMRAQESDRAGTTMLETGAFVSLVAALVGLTHVPPTQPVLWIGVGLSLGLLLLPGVTRPLLGFATAVVAMLRLDSSTLWIVLLGAGVFFVARSVLAKIFRD